MPERRLFQLISLLAAIGGGLPQLKAVAPKYFCQPCAERGRRSKIVNSVTGARYCHRCGWFERNQRP